MPETRGHEYLRRRRIDDGDRSAVRRLGRNLAPAAASGTCRRLRRPVPWPVADFSSTSLIWPSTSLPLRLGAAQAASRAAQSTAAQGARVDGFMVVLSPWFAAARQPFSGRHLCPPPALPLSTSRPPSPQDDLAFADAQYALAVERAANLTGWPVDHSGRLLPRRTMTACTPPSPAPDTGRLHSHPAAASGRRTCARARPDQSRLAVAATRGRSASRPASSGQDSAYGCAGP